MNGKILFEEITNIDNDMIINADKKRGINMSKILAVAASLVVIAGGVWAVQPASTANLKPITISPSNSMGMGFEGYLVHDIDQLVSANPFDAQSNLQHLPVFENTLEYNDFFRIDRADYEIMENILRENGELLGMDTGSLPITNNALDESEQKEIAEKMGEVPDGYFDLTLMNMEDDRYKLVVSTDYTLEIYPATPFTLPENLWFNYDMTYSQLQDVAQYFLADFAEFLDMKSPVVNIYGGDYNIYNQQMYHLSFYNEGDSQLESVVNYNFNSVQFLCDENGQLFCIHKHYTDFSEKMGDYPLISQEEATTLLENGNYSTSCPESFTDRSHIGKVDLIYRTGASETVLLPYYRFYVELPSYMNSEFNLKQYAAYYVPAIHSDHIVNMPIYDGGFN